MNIITTKNAKETEKVGEMLAREMKSSFAKGFGGTQTGQVICLQGDLGGGKTTFTKGFAKGLGIKQNITSPTFVLMKEYLVNTENIYKLYHLDCYRLKDSKDVAELGLPDIIKDLNNIVLIEWAERISDILPKNCLHIKFDFIDENTREIRITN